MPNWVKGKLNIRGSFHNLKDFVKNELEAVGPEVQEMIDLQDKIDAAIDGKKKLTQKDINRALEICQDNGHEFDFAE